MSQNLTNKTPHFKRSFKNILINPKYQIKYIFYISTSALLIVLFYSFITYYYIHENYALIIDLAPITEEAKSQLQKELIQLILHIAGISSLFITAVSFIGLKLSHRTAGPLYHFKRVFTEIRQGTLSARVKLRPKDDFQDVAIAFNEMMDTLEDTKKNSKTRILPEKSS